MRALVVEDDNELNEQITHALRRHGFAVDQSYDGEDAWFLGDTEGYEIVVLDLGLPKKDGISVLQAWRNDGNKVPVLVLTARDSWREKVAGLRAGADDYMAKPFEMEELLARVEALHRRTTGHASSVLELNNLTIDLSQQKVWLNGASIELSALEYRLIAYMVAREEQVISKSELTEHIYNQDFDHQSNVIEVLVNRVRKKIGKDAIKTRRGQGYYFIAP
ncbi:response regulator transcription factor [Salinibius halmophilus]|uniref:response regulator transcription factor n=1 Tax=Salinibius halmophilus TaxID=1853216 RepID=UPI000E65F0D0|nr:response regulator transcription factor [Salinibius halmophilus]